MDTAEQIYQAAKGAYYRLRGWRRPHPPAGFRQPALVFALHRVSPHDHPFWPPLHPDLLDELIVALRRDFELVPLRVLADVKAGGSPRGARLRPWAALTFDDGYRDFAEYAMPVLHRRGAPANLNVVPECILTGQPPWTVRLADFLRSAPLTLIRETRVPGFERRLRGTSRRERARFFAALDTYVKLRPRSERPELMQTLDQAMARAAPFAATAMLSADAIRGLGAGIEIGAHAYSHESMGVEPDHFFQRDFGECRLFFRETLRMPMQVYAFPNGSFRERQLRWLRRQGLRQILLVGECWNDLNGGDGGQVLHRSTFRADGRAEARLRAQGFGAHATP